MEGDATKNSAIFPSFSLLRGEIFTRSLVARRRAYGKRGEERGARERVPGSFFPACLFFANSPIREPHSVFRGAFIRRSMTSENTFGGNESDSNPSCISGRVR